MTSLPVKDIGAVMSRTTSSNAAGNVAGQTGSVSFESVWNNQTEKHNTSEPATEDMKTARKEDDTIARDSLKAKDSHKSVVKQSETDREVPADDWRNMSPEEWEKTMEVLGAAAAGMIQQVADAFDMTVEEVQGLMGDLEMGQLDILNQEGLSQLILAAGGAQDATNLLTNEELYQQFQTLTGELNSTLENVGYTLQADAGWVVQAAMEKIVLEDVNTTIESVIVENTAMENAVAETSEEIAEDILPVEITVDEEKTVEDDTVKAEEPADEILISRPTYTADNLEVKEQSGNQMQNQTQEQEQDLMQGKETTETKRSVTEHKGQGENLMLQNLKADNSEPQLQQVSQAVSTWDNETMDIMKQIMDYMKIQIKPDMSNVEMQLHPESLGTLQIHVASKGGAVTAQFVTQNETVKAVLESQMIQLKESFAEQGVKVEAIEVTVQTHQFEQNLEQGRGRQQDETTRKNRPRRIQLDGPLTMDDLGTMEEEEQLAAEMMAANGNTVDYTA